jgi:hypothetical protein
MIPALSIKGTGRENHAAHNAADDEKKWSPAHVACKESYAANHAACN